jgi:hypothetical protein
MLINFYPIYIIKLDKINSKIIEGIVDKREEIVISKYVLGVTFY